MNRLAALTGVIATHRWRGGWLGLLVVVLGAGLIGGPSAAPAWAGGPAGQTVASDWGLIPDGVEPGGSFRLLFVTSTTRDAASTDIADYNAHVQAAAGNNSELAAFSGEFRALISTSTVDARDNTGTTGTGVAVYWLGGAKVADDYADLYDRSWDSAAARTEAGAGYSGLVWTGGNKMGGKSGLRHAGAAEVRLGDVRDPNGLSLPLSSPNAGASGDAYPLYAMSPVFTVAEPESESESESESEPDQPGVVSLQMDTGAQVGTPIAALLIDPDGEVSGVTWQWARSANGTDWETIGGATEATYQVTSDDLGRYLQATASYSDPHGPGKTASASTSNPVVAPARKRLDPSTTSSDTATSAVPVTVKVDTEVWSATLVVDEEGEYHGCDNDDPDTDNCSSSTVLTDDSFVYGGTTYWVQGLFFDSDEDELTIVFQNTISGDDASTSARGLRSLTLNVGHGDGTALAVSDIQETTTNGLRWSYSPDPDWADNQSISFTLTGSGLAEQTVVPHAVQSGIVWSTTLTADSDSATTSGCDNNAATLGNCSARLAEDEFSYQGSAYKVVEFYHSTFTNKLYLQIDTASGSSINTKTTFSALTLKIGNSTFNIKDASSTTRINWSTTASLAKNVKYPIALFLPPGLPGEPRELSARRGHEEVVLSWRDPIDAGISKYQVQQQTGEADWPTSWTDISGSSAATTTHAVTGLTNGTEYRFRIRAVSGVGSGPYSEAGPATPSGAPYAPEGLTAASAGRVALSWTEAVDPSGSGVTRHQIQRRAGNGEWGDWTDIPNSAAGESNASSYRVSPLKNGTSWGFRVRAVNANGDGDASATVRATPSRSESPTVTGVEIVSRPRGACSEALEGSKLVTTCVGGGDTYAAGNKIRIRVTFSAERVVIEGRPVVALHVGGTEAKPIVRHARFLYPWGDNGALFEYRVAYGDRDADGVSIPKNGLIPLGRIYDRESGRDVNPKHKAVAANPAHRVNGMVGLPEEIVEQIPPSVAPRLERFSMVTWRDPGESYAVGEQIRVAAVFSETPKVDGRPTLALRVGSKIRQMELRQPRFSFPNRIVFTYTVQKGDIDGNGVSIPANPFRTSESDRFYDSWDGAPAVLTTDGMADRSGHEVGKQVWSATLTVDKSDGYYGCDTHDASHDDCSAKLSKHRFGYRGETYEVKTAFWQSGVANSNDNDTFAITFEDVSGTDDVIGSRALVLFANLVLNVNGTEFAVKDAVVRGDNEDIIQWAYEPDPDDWNDGDMVNLSLWAAAR